MTLPLCINYIVHHGYKVRKSLHVYYLPADRTAMPLTRNKPETTDRVYESKLLKHFFMVIPSFLNIIFDDLLPMSIVFHDLFGIISDVARIMPTVVDG